MEKIKAILHNKWFGFIFWSLLYILWFVVWTGNLWLLLGELVIVDLYFTHFLSRLIGRRNLYVYLLPPQPDLQIHLRVGQRNRFRNGRRLAHPHLRLPDVRHPVVVDGVVASHRRLPLREQGGLRPPDAQHAGVVPLRTPYDALLADEEILLGVHPMAVPPAQRIAQHRAQRRGGLQLPRRRHGAAPSGRTPPTTTCCANTSARWAPGRAARNCSATTRSSPVRSTNARTTSNAAWPSPATRSKSWAAKSMSTTSRRLPSRASSTCIR